MDSRIGEARTRDALAVRALHREVLEEGRFFVRTPAELPRLDRVEQDLARYRQSENSAWFVARSRVVPLAGFLVLTGGALDRVRHVARLEMMVDRRARRSGVGGALLDHALDWASANPLLEKVSLVVFSDNEAAIALYRSRGFQIEGRREGEYREADGALRGDVLMARMVPVSD